MTIIFALLALPLLAVPQRANGRPAEAILTLERQAECLTGAIPVPRSAAAEAADLGKGEWYLLIDAEDAAILTGQLDLTINGEKISGPLIPGISALDDWHYLKQKANGQAYLECAYIYDCMTQPAARTNLDLRQWFYLPLPQKLVDEARRRGCLNITLNHKVAAPTALFGASLAPDHACIPSRALYSWEKAFYGVENDSGLTDSRYDEKVPLRKAKWKMSFEKGSEDLEHFDLNLRVLAMGSKSDSTEEVTAGGSADVSLPISDNIVKAGPLTLLRATLTPGKAVHLQTASPGSENARPQLSLDWLDRSGKKITMPLPWLKTSGDILDIALPCNLGSIKASGGSQLTLRAQDSRPDCKIQLGARPIACHPIFGQGILY